MSYRPTDKPTVPQLCSELSSVTEWQHFAISLAVEMKHIKKIESNYDDIDRQKMAFFEVWLDVHPGATWSSVYDALVKIDKISLASSLVKIGNQSTLDTSSSSTSPHAPTSQRQKLKIGEKDEEFIEENLTKLHETFIEIIFEVKMAFSNLVIHQPAQLHNIIQYAEEAVSPSQVIQFDASNIDEFFHNIRPYYDFLDCKVIMTIAKKFIDGKIVQKLKDHSFKVKEFRRKFSIKQLAIELYQAFANIRDLPTLEAKLETPWEDIAIEGLYVLIQHLLPNAVKKHPQYSLMNNIVILPGCLLLQYGIRDRSTIDAIIKNVQDNVPFIRLMGIFQLVVDGTPVLVEDENLSFSFNTSLLEATKAGNIVAVQFILDIGANVNYQDGKGHTALIWAVLINNIDIIHELLQAGADVHIQGEIGYTALMVACGGYNFVLPPNVHRLSDNYRDTVRLLLSYGADPLASVDMGDGVLGTAFDAACISYSIDVVDLLLTDYHMPPEALIRGLYWALLGPATDTVKLLQSKVPDLDPLTIKLGVACGKGDTDTVKSIIEQGIDPNTIIVHGLTPLMIASSCGYINIANVLIHHGANINMVDDIWHYTALDHAEYEENHDMASLLEQHGGLCERDICSQDQSPM